MGFFFFCEEVFVEASSTESVSPHFGDTGFFQGLLVNLLNLCPTKTVSGQKTDCLWVGHRCYLFLPGLYSVQTPEEYSLAAFILLPCRSTVTIAILQRSKRGVSRTDFKDLQRSRVHSPAFGLFWVFLFVLEISLLLCSPG